MLSMMLAHFAEQLIHGDAHSVDRKVDGMLLRCCFVLPRGIVLRPCAESNQVTRLTVPEPDGEHERGRYNQSRNRKQDRERWELWREARGQEVGGRTANRKLIQEHPCHDVWIAGLGCERGVRIKSSKASRGKSRQVDNKRSLQYCMFTLLKRPIQVACLPSGHLRPGLASERHLLCALAPQPWGNG